MKKIVKVAACYKRYEKGEVYWHLPDFDSLTSNYITGQERSQSNPGGLTKLQIEAKDPLTDKQKEKYIFPIVMDPDTFRGVPLSRSTTFNLSTDEDGNYINPVDVDKYNFFKCQEQVIAPNSNEVVVNKHLFYFIDESKDAEGRNNARKAILKAQSKVFTDLTPESYYELFIYINHHENVHYRAIVNDKALTEDTVFEICEKYPNRVLTMFERGADDELFVLKLMFHGIITMVDGMFVDSKDKFIGGSTREVQAYLNKKGNHLLAAAWRKSLQTKDARYAASLKETDKKKK